MSRQVFIDLANDSVLFAIFMAETKGVSIAQINLWVHTMTEKS